MFVFAVIVAVTLYQLSHSETKVTAKLSNNSIALKQGYQFVKITICNLNKEKIFEKWAKLKVNY